MAAIQACDGSSASAGAARSGHLHDRGKHARGDDPLQGGLSAFQPGRTRYKQRWRAVCHAVHAAPGPVRLPAWPMGRGPPSPHAGPSPGEAPRPTLPLPFESTHVYLVLLLVLLSIFILTHRTPLAWPTVATLARQRSATLHIHLLDLVHLICESPLVLPCKSDWGARERGHALLQYQSSHASKAAARASLKSDGFLGLQHDTGV